MAKRGKRTLVAEERMDTVVYDRNGHEMTRLRFLTRDYEEDGVDITEKIAENIECGDGTVVNPSMMAGKDREPWAKCDACEEEARCALRRRNRLRMLLSPASQMRRCVSCGANLCARHYVTSAADGKDRCRRCHRRRVCGQFLLNCIVKPLFFKRS